ncbi:RDD family protein [Nitrososphaera viennensis]|uniref:RDD family protein n=2 Tax=Nitrososphaera viennensis TaxID=1034015 RepID=A0A060HQC1_9ARCH|nr:RDD family protein [Nitrososphaera viennensis]AIC15372.1 RDD family protein [Nitrososphaera viennensis EN76]UVS70270.1 RDD family protein [Nitrososphaera viennensis]
MSSETPAPSSGSQPELVLARWSDRFFAWLIDFIIVQVALGAIFAAAAFPFWFGDFSRADRFFWGDGPVRYAITSAVFFAYWTFFESTKGQSIGKMVLKIRTVDLAGRPVDTKGAAIQSFGKAFLLPIDVVLGWIFTNDKRQRLFNRASDTIVIKETTVSTTQQPGASYRKD